jgi:hypothetical protein
MCMGEGTIGIVSGVGGILGGLLEMDGGLVWSCLAGLRNIE